MEHNIIVSLIVRLKLILLSIAALTRALPVSTSGVVGLF